MTDPHDPGEELQDPKRAELIAEIGAIAGLESLNEVTAIFLWFSDMEKLQKFREILSKDPHDAWLYDVLRPGGNAMLRNVLLAWLAKRNALGTSRAKSAKRKATDTPSTASADEKEEK